MYACGAAAESWRGFIVVEALSVAYGMRVVPYVPSAWRAASFYTWPGLALCCMIRWAFDSLEYGCIVAIGFVMTVFGFSSASSSLSSHPHSSFDSTSGARNPSAARCAARL